MTDYAETVRTAPPEKLRVMVAERLRWALEWRYIYRWDQFEYITSDKPDGNHTERELCFWPEDTGQDRWFIVLDWPGDIAAAWELVDDAERCGLWLELKSPFRYQADPWFAGFTPHYITGWNGKPGNQASGATAPEAICRAWLLAMGEGDDAV